MLTNAVTSPFFLIFPQKTLEGKPTAYHFLGLTLFYYIIIVEGEG